MRATKYIISYLILCISCTTLVECCFMRQMHDREGMSEPDTSAKRSIMSAYSTPIDKDNCGKSGLYVNYQSSSPGTTAANNEFPWIASIQLKGSYDYKHICSGSFVASQYVVTAAHCFYRDNHRRMSTREIRTRMKIISGTNDIEPVFGVRSTGSHSSKIKHVWLRKKYVFSRVGIHNIAVVKLRRSLSYFHSPLRPICLPSRSEKIRSTLAIAGWSLQPKGGQDAYQLIKSVEPMGRNKHACGYHNLDRRLMCSIVKPQHTCISDTGGPGMILRNGQQYLMAIVIDQHACGGGMNMYTNVKRYSRWIQKVVLKMSRGRAPPRRKD